MEYRQRECVMEADLQAIENMRAQYESRLMAIKGVVSVSTGIGKTGKPCLKIGTSVPVEQVRTKLPEDLFQVEVELEYLGEIRAQ